MNLYLIFFVFISVTALAETCPIPFSRAGRVVLIDAEPIEVTSAPTALPKILTQTTQTATGVSTIASVVTAGTGVGPSIRGLSLQAMLSCDNNDQTDPQPLSWTDSPTQLSIGNSTLKYDLGAVVGNWALLGGLAGVWGAIATKTGTAEIRFPGGLTLPVLFLTGSTATSAVTLLRDGTYSEQIAGGFSLTAQLIATGVVAVFLHPTYFQAVWQTSTGKWVDGMKATPGYVKRYGMLFKDYHSGTHWFITVELLMSLATGILQSYQGTELNCRTLVTASAATSIAYAASILFFRPNIKRPERIFYGAISSLQALALSAQSLALWTASQETQEKVQTVTQSIMAATQWALLVKSVYDLAKAARSIYHYFAPHVQRHVAFGGLEERLLNMPEGAELSPLAGDIGPRIERIPEPASSIRSELLSILSTPGDTDSLEELHLPPPTEQGDPDSLLLRPSMQGRTIQENIKDFILGWFPDWHQLPIWNQDLIIERATSDS